MINAPVEGHPGEGAIIPVTRIIYPAPEDEWSQKRIFYIVDTEYRHGDTLNLPLE
jgi:hypothetical protein